MIPKILHFCNYNNYDSALYRHCRKSWRRYASDFEWIEWDESKLPSHPFLVEAYNAGKWAYISDYMRMIALYMLGGVYVDLDTEFVRSFDDVLDNKAFIGLEAVSAKTARLNAGMFGSVDSVELLLVFAGEISKHPVDKKLVINELMRKHFADLGLQAKDERQIVGDFTVYPIKWFTPLSFSVTANPKRKKAVYDFCTSETVAIQHYANSWFRDVSDQRMNQIGERSGDG